MEYAEKDVRVEKWNGAIVGERSTLLRLIHLPTGIIVNAKEHVSESSAWEEFRYRIARAPNPFNQSTT